MISNSTENLAPRRAERGKFNQTVLEAVMRRSILIGALALTSCTPVATNVVRSPAPVADTYTCVIRQLAEMTYTIKTAERDAGLIRAEKQDAGARAFVAGGAYFTEMQATILAPADGNGSELRVTVARTKETTGGARSGTGLVLTGGAKADATAVEPATRRDGEDHPLEAHGAAAGLHG
jgi:hypothetical protein